VEVHGALATYCQVGGDLLHWIQGGGESVHPAAPPAGARAMRARVHVCVGLESKQPPAQWLSDYPSHRYRAQFAASANDEAGWRFAHDKSIPTRCAEAAGR